MSETPNETPEEWVAPQDPDQELPRPKVTDAGDGELNPGPDAGVDPFHNMGGETADDDQE